MIGTLVGARAVEVRYVGMVVCKKGEFASYPWGVRWLNHGTDDRICYYSTEEVMNMRDVFARMVE